MHIYTQSKVFLVFVTIFAVFGSTGLAANNNGLNAQDDAGAEILELCLDPKVSNEDIFRHLEVNGWLPVELEEPATLVPPKDVDELSPEQIIALGTYSFSFGSAHVDNGEHQSDLEFFYNQWSRLFWFRDEERSLVFKNTDSEVVGISLNQPFSDDRTKCSYVALRDSVDNRIFDILPGQLDFYDYAIVERVNRDLTGKIIAYSAVSVEGQRLSEIFQTKLQNLVAYNISFDLNLD